MTSLPTAEQEHRAKWDLLLADLEYRQEQLRQSRPSWDLLLADLEYRFDQQRRIKQEMHWQPWQVVFGAMTAGAAITLAMAAIATGLLKLVLP